MKAFPSSFLFVFLAVTASGHEWSCSFHADYCFLADELPQGSAHPLNRSEKFCRSRRGVGAGERGGRGAGGAGERGGRGEEGWPLETYDVIVRESVKRFLAAKGLLRTLGAVPLGVERSDGGWRLVQNGFFGREIDPEINQDGIRHVDDVAYYDLHGKRFETGWFGYFELPYLCSHATSSPECIGSINNNSNTILIVDNQCFVLWRRPRRKWFEAQNNCLARGGHLGLVRPADMLPMEQWLSKPTVNSGEGQWWVGLAWRPLRWRKKGTLVTWTDFQRHHNLREIPETINFDGSGENTWTAGDESESSPTHVICMKENSPCSGECQLDSNYSDSTSDRNWHLILGLVLGFVALTFIVVFIVIMTRKCRRVPNIKPSPYADCLQLQRSQPINARPLPDSPPVYEVPSECTGENAYEELRIRN